MCSNFYFERQLTEGFFVSPTSCPHKDKTLTNFSRVLFCRGHEEMQKQISEVTEIIHILYIQKKP